MMIQSLLALHQMLHHPFNIKTRSQMMVMDGSHKQRAKMQRRKIPKEAEINVIIEEVTVIQIYYHHQYQRMVMIHLNL